ncbi:GNAT family N-acetyltransferase [Chromobacterium violaceum]|uniref:GNAT family N-acetyltransferase n=1 Tax=Chromobacterium violaceum TaxID=536 RepID=UPI0015F836A7|nr:GNAT family N-acetyltransferase [Chromobacterium violaceum]MBA8734532.1 GNAT family N-acetyltransferase [Chromobacterium violaceum]MBP4043722.1 GNAT family N-acetyltransferase [Chromobacterium violaceum]
MSQPYLIRSVEPSDAAALHRIKTSPGVYPDTLQLPHQPLAVTEKQLNERPANLHQLVACAGGGEVVGSVGIIVNEGMRVRHSAELFLVVRDDWQGKGAGGAMMRAIIDLADNWLGLIRIELKVIHDNARAIALYEKFGFEYEGRLRQEQLRAGKLEDVLVMGRLNWPRRAEA